jgi:nucleoside-diphosphate-sugar epimerase
MTTLVVGASGATGKLLVEQLLQDGKKVKIVVRSTSNIPDSWKSNEQLIIVKGNISEISVEEMSEYITDCQSVACCLGHNLTFKGIYGKPRNLVTASVSLLCEAISRNTPVKPVKFVLMNTTGNRNRDLNEPISYGERIVIALLRLLLPPHPDNEKAADFLRVNVGQSNPYIEWVAVRPDTLIDQESVTEYSLHKSPTSSALFKPGKTSRISGANLMSRLLSVEKLWYRWRGEMAVISSVM